MNYNQSDISGNSAYFPFGSFNNDPYAKNYSNCDVLGSFYTVGDSSPKDISGNTVWDIYNKKAKAPNIVYNNDISGNVQYIYNNDISGNKVKIIYNKDIGSMNTKARYNNDISGNRIMR